MLNGFIILIAYLFTGDILSVLFDLRVPGGVVGMVLMLITLIIRGKVDILIDNIFAKIKQHLCVATRYDKRTL